MEKERNNAYMYIDQMSDKLSTIITHVQRGYVFGSTQSFCDASNPVLKNRNEHSISLLLK